MLPNLFNQIFGHKKYVRKKRKLKFIIYNFSKKPREKVNDID